MFNTIFRFAFVSLCAIVLFAGCSDDPGKPPQDTSSVSISYTALRQTDTGENQVGVEFEIAGFASPTQTEIIVDGSPVATKPLSECTKLEDGVYEIFVPVPDPGETSHRVQVRVSGTGSQQAASAEKSYSRDMRCALVENVSNGNCQNCPVANEYFKEKTRGEVAQLRFAPVRYHGWWPNPKDSLYLQSKPVARPRVEYLFSPMPPTSAPYAWVDGQDASSSPATWIAQGQIDQEIAPGARIQLTPAVNGSSVQLEINVFGLSAAQYSDLRLHTVVTESNVFYNGGNDEYYHDHVVRAMLPNQEGESVSISDGVWQTFTRDFTLVPYTSGSQMHVVVFLQRASGKSVLQAALVQLR